MTPVRAADWRAAFARFLPEDLLAAGPDAVAAHVERVFWMFERLCLDTYEQRVYLFGGERDKYIAHINSD